MSETVNKVAVLSSAVKHALLADVQYYDFHASSAFNRKMKGIITPGFYGGFEPALAGGLNLKITSLQGPGGHGVASVDVNNHQITVQQIEDVTLAIPVNGVTRVMLEANYQYGVKTSQVDDSSDIHAARIFTANISVPLADNHLEICRVTVPADATELTLDMIDSSHRRNKALGITLSSEIDSDADHIGASSHAVKKAVKAARDETEKQIEELVDNAPASLDTLKKIADAINNDPDFFNTLNAVLALKAPLHDPALTGIATVPTPPLSVSNKQIANTEYVQAAVAALVGSSPEALDTLAELADALGNDPNFATTMLNKLAGKQPLDNTLTNLSGKDVAGLIQYLGLVETINRAAGALQKDQNLSDIPDKAQARNALQLGTAATATLTTSTTDDTTGRVLKVGDRGLGKGTIPALRGFDFYQYWFAAGETLFIETNSAINFPPGMPEFANTYVYVNVVGIRDSGNDCALLLSRYDTNISYLAWRIHEANTSINWRVLKIPTAAADIRAIPKDPIGTIGHNGRMASADTPGWWLVSVDNAETVADFPKYPNGNRLYSYGFMFVARSGDVWLQQYFSHTGASASRQTWNGDMSEQTPWVIDYNTAYKPTSADVRAFALGQTGSTVANDKAVGWDWDSGAYNAVIAGSSAMILHFNIGSGSCPAVQFLINYKNGGISYRSARDRFGFEQDWSGIYTTSNPPPAPDLSGYATQQWVLQNFVQNIRVSAPQERKFWDGNGWSGNDSAFATAIWMVGGSSNVGGLYVRYVQKNINGTWINVTE